MRGRVRVGTRLDLDLPIIGKMHEILFGGKEPRMALRELMERPLKVESLSFDAEPAGLLTAGLARLSLRCSNQKKKPISVFASEILPSRMAECSSLRLNHFISILSSSMGSCSPSVSSVARKTFIFSST